MKAPLSRILAGDGPKSGELYVYGAISSSPWADGISSSSVVDALEEMKKAGCESVSVFINSPGGDAFEGVAILNCLKRFDGQVNVMVDGIAASAASLIAMAGDTICMGSGAMMMVHDPATLIFGDAAALREKADMLEKVSDAMLSAYCERTKMKSAEMRQLMVDETWLTADDAVKRGFADKVFTQDEPEPQSSSDHELLAKYRRTPQAILAAARRPPLAGQPGMQPPKEHEPMKTLLVKLGLSESATEAQAIVALDQHFTVAAEFRKLAGKTSDAEALGVFMAWRAGSERAETVSRELADIKAKTAEAEVVAAIDGAIRDGKATPAQRDSLVAMGKASPDTLKAFIAAAPKVHGEHKAPEKKTGLDGITLSDEERTVALKMGQDPEKVLAAKKKAIEEGRAPFVS